MQPLKGDLKTRLTFLMLLCIGAAGTILVRSVFIQLLNNPRLELVARRQFHSNALIRPRRGAILDRNGEPLAVNVEKRSLAANPSKIRNKASLARLLSRSLLVPHHRLLERLNENKEFVWLKRHLSDADLKRLRKWRLMNDVEDFIDGLWLVKESNRVYPHQQLAAHLLGSVNIDSEGLEGVELWMNERLRGKVVSVSAVKDAFGRPAFLDAVAAKGVQDGGSVTLTIDASLQYEVEQELREATRTTGAKAGTVIVLNASNGEILALANEPSFDPNQKGISPDRRRNRALTDGYEPGSTFKALLLASALSHGWKLKDQIWGEKGSLVVQGHRISEAHSSEKFEWISLSRMIQVSSNVVAAKLALKLGAERFLKTLKAFGFGSRSELGFPGEIAGRLPAKKEWAPLTLANIGFGQGILVTPIQMTRAFAAFINGGYLVTPKLIHEGLGRETSTKKKEVLSLQASQAIVDAMTLVTQTGGTATRAALPGYRVGGKTGTAQLIDSRTGRYSRDKYISSFIGFAAGVEPKIVIFTSLTEPKGSYYASKTAAPLFREVLSSVANRCGLPSQTQGVAPRLVKRQLPQGYDRVQLSQAAVLLPAQGSLATPFSVMPSLKGLSPREVVRVLKGASVRLSIQGTGVVHRQTPEEGKKIAEGELIRIILAEP